MTCSLVACSLWYGQGNVGGGNGDWFEYPKLINGVSLLVKCAHDKNHHQVFPINKEMRVNKLR